MSTITDEGQTMVPLEVRSALGMQPRPRLIWETGQDRSAGVRPAPSVMELSGCLKSDICYQRSHAENDSGTKA